MQIVVKSLKLDEGVESSWYRSIEGRLIRDDEFTIDISENFAFNYFYGNNEGYIYLYSLNDKRPEKVREYKLYIKFLESEKQLAQEVVQKYLMFRTKFWDTVNDAFQDVTIDETVADNCDFTFDFNIILNSQIKLPEILIDKQYSLPMIIPITENRTLELLASGINRFNDVHIVTTDSLDGVEDYKSTVFISNTPDLLKAELRTKMNESKKMSPSFIVKLITVVLSSIGGLIIGVTFIKKLMKEFKKIKIKNKK